MSLPAVSSAQAAPAQAAQSSPGVGDVELTEKVVDLWILTACNIAQSSNPLQGQGVGQRAAMHEFLKEHKPQITTAVEKVPASHKAPAASLYIAQVLAPLRDSTGTLLSKIAGSIAESFASAISMTGDEDQCQAAEELLKKMKCPEAPAAAVEQPAVAQDVAPAPCTTDHVSG